MFSWTPAPLHLETDILLPERKKQMWVPSSLWTESDSHRGREQREYVDLQQRLWNLCRDYVDDRRNLSDFLHGIGHNIRFYTPLKAVVYCYTPLKAVVYCRHLLRLSVRASILVNATPPKVLIGSSPNLVNIIIIMGRCAWSRDFPVQWFFSRVMPLET